MSRNGLSVENMKEDPGMKKVVALFLALVLLMSIGSAALADEVKISLWTVFTGDDGATLQALIDQFNEAYAGKISVEHSPLGDPYTNLYLAVQSGTDIPDVMIGHVERIPKMVDDGILTDLTVLTEGDVDLANYPEHVLAFTNYDGYQYGIPWDFNAPVLYVNLDLIAKYGLEGLLEDGYVTFDEIKEAGAAVAAAGDSDSVKVLSYYGANFNEFVARYEEYAQEDLFPDGKLSIDPEKWGGMLSVFREIYELGYGLAKEEDATSHFLGGDLIFFENGTWTNATLMQVEGLNYTAVMMPVFSAETALCRSGSHTWMQPENEDRTEETDMAVATFINWMGANSLTWATKAGQVPLYKSVTEMDEFKACVQTFLANAGLAENIKIYRYFNWGSFTGACAHAGNDFIFDSSIDLNSIGAAIQAEVDDAIAAGN